MATAADPAQLAAQARRHYIEELHKGLPGLVTRVTGRARDLLDKPAERAVTLRRRDLVDGLAKRANAWRQALSEALMRVAVNGASATKPFDLPAAGTTLSLVDNETIEREILTSRLALAVMDKASWEFTDLRGRIAHLERRGELDPQDLLRAHVLARVVLDAWRRAGLTATDWREAQPVLHEELALLAEEAYHETNRWLVGQHVQTEVDLRPFIRRRENGSGFGNLPTEPAHGVEPMPGDPQGGYGGHPQDTGGSWGHGGPAGRAGYGGPSPAGHGAHAVSGYGSPARGGAAAGPYGAPAGQGGAGGPGHPAGPVGPGGRAPGAGSTGYGRQAGPDTTVRRPSAVAPAVQDGARPPSATLGGGYGGGYGSGHGGGAQERSRAWPGRGGQGPSVAEETRLMTRAAPMVGRGGDHAEAVLGRLNRLVGRHLPGFADTTLTRPVSEALSAAIQKTQQSLRRRFTAGGGELARATVVDRGQTGPASAPPVSSQSPRSQPPPSKEALLEDLRQNTQALKQAAATPAERATIEIVAMMFASILTEERIPPAVRVWFARLQMPVLRVAVTEPDFFATIDHPARRLIDRMGACVMGLDSASGAVGGALEKEIKRVVQVVEAYPDTGRRVFQTVLVEFEKFLENYFKNENEASRKGVSLAQQVEQRETLAIQYTIELRRMLNEVPVQEGVRQFLFQVWADVLATCAVRHGRGSPETKTMKRAAADLIWSASAKVSREERADVIRRLPPLLKRLREGMDYTHLAAEKQDEHIHALNNALAAAFTAKAAAIPNDRLNDLMERLESLEEMLPGSEHLEIDESLVLDLSGHETSELEVVTEGGTLPTAAMVAWARELLVGSWYTLEYRDRTEPVQLAWQGLKRQLSLFVTSSGRCVLFQQQRLASFLQAGLLLPAQEEALTVKATRNALARLDADPTPLVK